ncbi:MAG: hypothetical protein ACLQVJ_29350 [Syntrophobacteraceae bacterium]
MPANKRWMSVPRKPATPKIPDGLKLEVQRKADELLESYLKPNFILPPPQDPQWNYVVEIFTKWHQRYFYFCSKYRCPGQNCILEFFESRFARLEYVGIRRFNLSYMRHTGQWCEIFQGLTLEECLEEIRQQELLHP